MLLLAVAFISNCSLTFHDVTWQVTGSVGMAKAGIAHSFDNDAPLYTVQSLPWSYTYHIRDTNANLYADTAAATSGSVTATILVDGIIASTATATASGTTASVQISASVPH